MCKNHTDLEASEVRELPAEARRMDRPVRMPAPRPEDVWPALASLAAKPKAVEMRPESVKMPAIEPRVERAPEVSADVQTLRDRIRVGARAVLADEARLPTGRAAKFERVKFREEALKRYAKGLGIELPSGQEQFSEAAKILRAKLMETFDTQEVEKLMPKFLRKETV